MPLHSHSARNASSSLVFSFQDLNSNPIGSPDTAGGRVSLSPKDIHGWMRGADISRSVTTFSLALEEVLPLAVTSDPRPFNQQLPEPPDPRCVLEPQDNPEVAPALVCALCCCFGIIYCCFGLFLISQMHKGRHIPPLGSKATMGGRQNMGACE
uniref:Uncharacterized protein n=1 Tax=Theropithecus gelada TaxID=9565 RepID=A0A8D2F313_THEGE